MSNPLRRKGWSPYVVGAAIGVLSWFAFASAEHPLGITTAFEHTAALAATAADAEGAYHASPDHEPVIGWEWMLVVGVFFGALASASLSGDRGVKRVPALWARRFGASRALRYGAAFVGAAVMMYGARLAQGCTSGHGISGTLQLAVSSWVFIITAFLVGIAVVFLMYGTEGRRHV